MNGSGFTIWASMKGEEPGPWMLAAEDEVAWQSDPERCDAVFKAARDLAEKNGWDAREIELRVDYNVVAEAFGPVRLDASVIPVDDAA